MPLSFSSPSHRLPKRKLSGSIPRSPPRTRAATYTSQYPSTTRDFFVVKDQAKRNDETAGLVDLTIQKRSARRTYSDDTIRTKPFEVTGAENESKSDSSWLWFCGLWQTIDLREVAAFVMWEALIVLIVVLAVTDWIFFFKFVVEPDDGSLRAKYGAAWVTFTALLVYLRHYMRSVCGPHIRSLAQHAEIFVTVSLVMVFSTNIAFYLHAPLNEPLRDLGFMLVPPQTEDSKWRPLSDMMTALLPIFCMIQSYCMTRENRCRVMITFFRAATVCYALRTFTVSLTSLPGPAPHCRPGSPLYFPPETWIDIITRVGPMYGKFYSCGDLIFSGHMSYTNTAMLLYLRTLDRYFPRFSRLRWALGMLYLVALAALCISGRKHYTVDVVLGFFISTLVYFHFELTWVPPCLHPPEEYALLLVGPRRSKQELDSGDDDLKQIIVVESNASGKNCEPGSSLTDFIC